MIELLALLAINGGIVTRGPSPSHPNAVDVSCVVGEPVYAVSNGHVHSYWAYATGNTLELHTDDGRYLYGHLHSVRVPSGLVTDRQIIGTCGNTGAFTTGPHLHFEVLTGETR